MTICKKCKKSLGMFQTKVECIGDDCPNVYCEACALSELIICPYCEDKFCKKCSETHTPDCKEENETTEEDEEETCEDCGELMSECTCNEEEEVPDGMYFNKEKTICILDMEDNKLSGYVDQIATLRKDFNVDKELSTPAEMVWIKKV